MIAVPEQFARDTITREGEAGRRWISELPGRIETLLRRWRLRVDGPLLHGYLGVVVPVLRGKEACVLKVAWIDEGFAEEAVALDAWDGRGAVRLLELLPSQGAMLLERLDHTRSLNDVPIDEAVTIAGRLLRRLAIPAPPAVRTQRSMSESICRVLPERWQRYGRPVSRALLDRVVDMGATLGTSSTALLVNYDLHYLDVLAAGREPWLAVDPKVLAGEPEFGLAQLMWTRLEDMEAAGGLERHFHALVDAAELDLELARQWTIVRCLDYWFWGLTVGLTHDPARCRRIIHCLL